MNPRALDLFCGAGGASMGLHRAGYEVVGVDLAPQPNYPFEFVQADALEFPIDGFDLIWASPPCQAFSISRNNGCHKDAPDLVAPVRDRLRASEAVYIIENVYGAPLVFPVLLCGQSFGLGVAGLDLCRHRYFESNILLLTPECRHRRGKTIGVYGHGTNTWHRKKLGRCVTEAEKRIAMSIDWMTRAELSQAIPPAYSEFLARQVKPSPGART